MSVISQAGMATVNRSNRRPPPQCVTACTHIRMDRLFGNWTCDMCQNPSPLGWLYRCSSDVPEVGDYAFIKSITHPVSPAGERLRQLGLSESIIKEFERGGYTDEQVQTLIRQKQQVQEKAAQPFPSDDIRCDFKVCQRCAGVRKDRCWLSFEAVFADEVRSVDKYEMTEILPIKDVRIAKQLGLRRPIQLFSPPIWGDSPYGSPNHSPSSDYTDDGFSTDGEYDDESCGDALSGSSHDGDNHPRAGVDMSFVTLRDPRHAHTPRSTIRLVPDSESRRIYRASIASNDDESPSHSHTTTSSISLPTIPTTTSYSILPGCEETVQELRAQYSLKAMTDPEFYSGHPFDLASSVSSESSFGSEVAVEGDFALTEEATSTHTPAVYKRA
ncbi:hypothetical protein M436DRAFT_69216 [Aureobasidium namibiae CBS 147.97]|uniref:Uncharacterized protein n=1 Tax=Aureobasidium namibiae CBS 147.97 TaxID=1043004 RepID=A0A074WY24_9PEZI|nr:uncharacterized protein M436DRAFT_69216 [Aureobasidium namibiae CBS 147.97]KEQ78083.1 hypothetical protein M436DRAFT_69216 [Aureobasidium namibiae CBS 147.97]